MPRYHLCSKPQHRKEDCERLRKIGEQGDELKYSNIQKTVKMPYGWWLKFHDYKRYLR